MPRLMIRTLLTLTFVLTASAAGAGVITVSAQEPGAAVIAKWVCPDGLTAGEIDPAECTEAASGVEFYAANPGTDNVAFDATGGDGIVSFPLDQFAISPDGATMEVGEILGSNPYGEVTGSFASCTLNGEAVDASLVDSDVQPGGSSLAFQVTVMPGDQLACDWYNSFAGTDNGDDGGNDDGDDDGSETPPVTDLPDTGTGAASGDNQLAVWLAGASALALAGGVVTRVATRRSEARIR